MAVLTSKSDKLRLLDPFKQTNTAATLVSLLVTQPIGKDKKEARHQITRTVKHPKVRGKSIERFANSNLKLVSMPYQSFANSDLQNHIYG